MDSLDKTLDPAMVNKEYSKERVQHFEHLGKAPEEREAEGLGQRNQFFDKFSVDHADIGLQLHYGGFIRHGERGDLVKGFTCHNNDDPQLTPLGM